jgi:ubiquinone/menaquinone biosynthesis C-methylase UbiE
MTDSTQPVSASEPPPYFDDLFEILSANDPATLSAFGRHLHVHWGYWDNPAAADGSAEDYAQAAEKLCRLMCDAAGIRDGLRVLDVGCGFGGTIASINERFDDLELVGVNIDPRQLERAARIEPRGNNCLRWVCDDACDLSLQDEMFDVVMAVECIFHFPDRAKFFAEASRVLVDGGVLAICDFIPPERIVPYLDSWVSPQLAAIQKSHGRQDMTCSTQKYREIGAQTSFALTSQFDMTPGTLPTYTFLRSHMQNWEDARLAERFDKAIALLQKASKKGLLEYKILTFTKQVT